MARNTSWRHQYGIEADVTNALIRVTCKPSLGRRNYASALAFRDGPSRVIEVGTRLDLDENEEPASARDDVDFPDWALPSPRQDAKALGDEKCRRPALGRNPGAERYSPDLLPARG